MKKINRKIEKYFRKVVSKKIKIFEIDEKIKCYILY